MLVDNGLILNTNLLLFYTLRMSFIISFLFESIPFYNYSIKNLWGESTFFYFVFLIFFLMVFIVIKMLTLFQQHFARFLLNFSTTVTRIRKDLKQVLVPWCEILVEAALNVALKVKFNTVSFFLCGGMKKICYQVPRWWGKCG